MKRLSKREKGILILCIFVASSYVGFNFVFKPMQKKIRLLNGKIKTKERDLTKYTRVISRGKATDEEYLKYSKLLKQNSSDEQEMASILSEIESVANEIDMRVADMKPNKVKRVDFYNNFSVSLATEGKLDTIIHFLYILQNAPHQFNVDEVRFEKRSTRTTKIKCRFVLSRVLIP